MEVISIKDLTFTYPNKANSAIKHLDLDINQGEFVVICGKSGCGKTTLLKHFKPILTPHGTISGEIYFEGKKLSDLDLKEQAEKIGFVQQSPDNQIVTDKVWHELAFGLESLGYKTPEIRAKVAEMASFFGIQTWFHKKVTELSGGQKQLLNLASIMVMQPTVLILDEPTSQLDPIAATDFLETIAKINRELGTTIILTEHRLEEAFALADRVVVMENGSVIVDGEPEYVGEQLKKTNNDMFVALPTPMKIYSKVDSDLKCPVTVKQGREWLEQFAKIHEVDEKKIKEEDNSGSDEPIIEIDDVWFKYEKDQPDIVKGLTVTINRGELFAIVGGNGTGKTTSLSLMSGINRPYRGSIKINGKKIEDVTDKEKFDGLMGVMPQNPQALFVKKTVELDLYEMLSEKKMSKVEKDERVNAVSELCELDYLMDYHPYDLSGGEQQRLALAKVLLLTPKILLLDEPTKGLDGHFKQKFAHIMKQLQSDGVTIIMVSHDIEFCAENASKCAMFFDGSIVSVDKPREFFSGKSFYTTSANRMSRTILPQAVLCDDVILACGGKVEEKNLPKKQHKLYDIDKNKPKDDSKAKVKKKFGLKNILFCVGFLVLFLCTYKFLWHKWIDWRNYVVEFLMILEVFCAFSSVIPSEDLATKDYSVQVKKEKRVLSKRTITSIIMVLVLIPLTIFIGSFYLQDRKYYFISLMIMLETFVPFMISFESRKPQPRELIVIAVLSAIGVVGRIAFFFVPQFKPVLAIVIISGVCFGGETGFLVGTMTAFVSNMYFQQGPWTPWQMFAFGMVGLVAGVLFRKGFLTKTRSSLCIYGSIAAVVINGFILDLASAIMWQSKLNFKILVSYCMTGIPFNLVLAFATAVFLWFLAGPMIEKLDRIKVKYGILDQ